MEWRSSALAYAERTLGIDRLLLRPELRTDAGKVFLDRYGELIELTASGQFAMRRLLAEHLKRIEWDSSSFPVRLYPFLSGAAPSEERSIVIDPRIAFGRPVVLRRGVPTSAIAERIDAERRWTMSPPITSLAPPRSSRRSCMSGRLELRSTAALAKCRSRAAVCFLKIFLDSVTLLA